MPSWEGPKRERTTERRHITVYCKEIDRPVAARGSRTAIRTHLKKRETAKTLCEKHSRTSVDYIVDEEEAEEETMRQISHETKMEEEMKRPQNCLKERINDEPSEATTIGHHRQLDP